MKVIRSEFEELGLEMVGMTTFMGETSAFIRTRAAELPQRFDVGDRIGAYSIVSIQTGYVIFERSGVQLWLPLGERENATPDSTSEGTRGSATVSHKRASREMKVRTSSYETASVLPAEGFLPSSLRISQQGPSGVFVLPMKGRLTSDYGYRKRPTGGARRYHRGIDIAAAYGTPIRSAAAGRVTKVSRSWAKGLNIEIEHSGGYATAYFHLHKSAVSVGEYVAQGELIAYEGNSGNSTGPHLHFEIHKNGQPVNPALYLSELN
jgi:murein DD-endopeptidase MepM/ murein hydrolase activator NlpD